MASDILRTYCFCRPGRVAKWQWELALGTGIVTAFKVFARWDDAKQLRWDEGYFELTELYARFFLEHRKNAQYSGNFVDVARAQGNARGAYHAIVEAYFMFRTGHVLPFISAHGEVDTSRHMSYRSYVRHLRRALVKIGVPPGESETFSGQLARSGAATTAARAGVPPHELCRLAGVSSINWCLAYMRPDFGDRMRDSWAIDL